MDPRRDTKASATEDDAAPDHRISNEVAISSASSDSTEVIPDNRQLNEELEEAQPVQEFTEDSVRDTSISEEAGRSSNSRPHRAPWGQPATNARVNIPSHFPAGLVRMITHLPLMGELESVSRNIKQLITDFIDTMFPPFNMLRLQQLSSFFALMPKDILQDLTYSIAVFVEMCFYFAPGSSFSVGEYLHYHTSLHPSGFIPWMMSLEAAALQDALGIPGLRKDHLRHLLKHVRINVKPAPEVKFTITVTPCSDGLYTPSASDIAEPLIPPIQRFINSLPSIPIEGLEEEDRICSICRVEYGQPGSLLDELPEGVLQLPCKHTFGKLCLTVLLRPQYERGWNWRRCPMCRREIEIAEDSGLCLLAMMWFDDGRF